MTKPNSGNTTLKVIRAFVWCMRQHAGFTRAEFYTALSEWCTEGESPRFLNFLVKGGYLVRTKLDWRTYLYIPQSEHKIPDYKIQRHSKKVDAGLGAE